METTAKVPCFPSCRATLCLTGFAGGLIFFLMRSNISVAVVCMTTPEYTVVADLPETPHWEDVQRCKNETYSRGNSELEGFYTIYRTRKCAKRNGNPPYRKWSAPEFFWTRDVKGVILSAFSYGYISTQFIASILAKKFGPKKVVVFGYSLVVLATALSPKSAEWSPYALAALQVVKGMAGGVFFPCYWTMWGKWAPPMERTTLVGLMMAGNSLGNILAFILSGYLCDYVGWESVFYAYGIVGAAWIVVFLYFVYEDPEIHPRISDEELMYLRKTIIKTKGIIPLKEVPFKSILSSVAVWAVALSEIGFGYGYYMMITEIPQYLVDVMHTDISENGVYTALPHICNFAICFIAPLTCDWMIRKGVKRVYVRKVMQSIALFPAGGMMLGIGYLNSDQLSAVLVCLGLYGLTATYRSGSITNQVEIAPKYAGIVSGVVNTLASLPGTFAPFVTGVLVENGTRDEWRYAFFIAGIFSIVGGIIYLIFAKGEVQPWALESSDIENLEKEPLKTNDNEIDNNNSHFYNYGSTQEKT